MRVRMHFFYFIRGTWNQTIRALNFEFFTGSVKIHPIQEVFSPREAKQPKQNGGVQCS